MTDQYLHHCTAIKERQGDILDHCKRMDEEVSRRLVAQCVLMTHEHRYT